MRERRERDKEEEDVEEALEEVGRVLWEECLHLRKGVATSKST